MVRRGSPVRVRRWASKAYQAEGEGCVASTRVLRVIAPAAAGCLITIVAITPSLAAEQESPQRPQLPRDFRGVGRYIVPDLNENVPFTWQGKDGDSQMTAGGPKDRIWFENLIYRGTLYTITYEWPGLKEEEKAKCVAFGGLDRDWLNGTLLKTSRYVGKEVLQGTPNRHVNHWRAGLVFLQDIQPDPGQPLFPRIPAMVADIYVSQEDPTKWWKVLQFGVQTRLTPHWMSGSRWIRSALRPERSRFRQSAGRSSRPHKLLSGFSAISSGPSWVLKEVGLGPWGRRRAVVEVPLRGLPRKRYTGLARPSSAAGEPGGAALDEGHHALRPILGLKQLDHVLVESRRRRLVSVRQGPLG